MALANGSSLNVRSYRLIAKADWNDSTINEASHVPCALKQTFVLVDTATEILSIEPSRIHASPRLDVMSDHSGENVSSSI
jgi:hypothetical protein